MTRRNKDKMTPVFIKCLFDKEFANVYNLLKEEFNSDNNICFVKNRGKTYLFTKYFCFNEFFIQVPTLSKSKKLYAILGSLNSNFSILEHRLFNDLVEVKSVKSKTKNEKVFKNIEDFDTFLIYNRMIDNLA